MQANFVSTLFAGNDCEQTGEKREVMIPTSINNGV